MNSSELERFQSRYEEMIQAMKLHGLRTRTIESYCSSMRRVGHFFDRCPDDLRAPRIISTLQRLCDHGKAAKEAAEQQDNVSTLDEIA